MAYIAYSVPKNNGAIYAAIVESTRNDAKVSQKRIANLGRVVDQEQGIFKSRERGLFRYTVQGGFSNVEASDYSIPCSDVSASKQTNERLILDFGDSYILNKYIQQSPILCTFMDILPDWRDTVLSLLFYRILTDKKAYCHASAWWEGNYARILFPKARLASQRISEILVKLGEEEVLRRFFNRYLEALYGSKGDTGTAILIDSSGLPNASGMSITQLNNHNGDISLEVRLIYVIDRHNGMPIYFRYCPGNIVDVSTLCATMAELSQYNVSVEYAIVDAGYFSEPNVKELYRNNVHFVTRLAPNLKLYKGVVASQLDDILSTRYAIRYGTRLVYIKKVKIDVYGHEGYAYVGVDVDSRNAQVKRVMFNSMDEKLSMEEIDSRIARLGVFVLLSSDDMDTNEILPLYYTRQQVEQVFDIAKNNADILPLRIQGEDTFRGHLMLTFLATAILQKLQRDILARRKKGNKTNPEGAFLRLRNQKCKVYSENIIPQEAVKEINDVYKLLGIDFPASIAQNRQM
jgi:hypothetical protein